MEGHMFCVLTAWGWGHILACFSLVAQEPGWEPHELSDVLKGCPCLTIQKSQRIQEGENTVGKGPPHRLLVTRALLLE